MSHHLTKSGRGPSAITIANSPSVKGDHRLPRTRTKSRIPKAALRNIERRVTPENTGKPQGHDCPSIDFMVNSILKYRKSLVRTYGVADSYTKMRLKYGRKIADAVKVKLTQ